MNISRAINYSLIVLGLAVAVVYALKDSNSYVVPVGLLTAIIGLDGNRIEGIEEELYKLTEGK